jgi:hypothetical protein
MALAVEHLAVLGVAGDRAGELALLRRENAEVAVS